MKLSRTDAALLCWTLENALELSENHTEQQGLESLLIRLSAQLPFAPYCSASEWRAAELS